MQKKNHFIATALLVIMLLPLIGSVVAQDNVTLTVWSWRTEDEDAYNEIFSVYEAANPGVTVEFVPFVNTDYNNILATGLTGDGGPDVVQLRAYGTLQPLIEAGQLLPLDGVVGTLENFTTAILKGSSGIKDGHIYGVPFGVQALGAFYNMDIFDELGVSAPETWDDFVAILDAAAAAGYIPLANPAKDSWMLPILHDAVAASRYGGPEFEAAVLAGDTNFNDPNYVASLQVVKDLQPYLPPDVVGVAYNDARTLFISGLSPIFIGGSFEIGFWQSQAPDMNVGMFMVPPPPDSLTGPLVPSWMDGSYGVNARTDSQDAALALVEWMGTPEFGQLFTDKIHQISPVADVVPSDPLLAEFANGMVENPASYLLLVNFRYGDPSGTTVLGEQIQRMFLDEITPEEAAANLETGMEQWFVPANAK
ncbi:MAG: extracellular solute-binding protein [Anaerolineae bacterium]|nr:extracellular solute-binding protein [Anaerolineae bacterium]